MKAKHHTLNEQEVSEEIKEEKYSSQDLSNAIKAVLRRKFITIIAQIRKEKRPQGWRDAQGALQSACCDTCKMIPWSGMCTVRAN